MTREASARKIIATRESLSKIVKMLSLKNVKVTQQGQGAFVTTNADGEPLRVNVPNIPDNASMDLIKAIQGYLDHEVSHILFSDFRKLNENAIEKGGAAQNVTNVVEDTWIERHMSARFKGSAYNLQNTRSFFMDEIIEPLVVQYSEPQDKAGALLVPYFRALAGHQICEDWMKDKGYWDLMKDTQSLLGDEQEWREKFLSVSCSDDAIVLADEIMERLGNDFDPGEQEGHKTESSSGEDESDTDQQEQSASGEKGEDQDDDSEEKSDSDQGQGEGDMDPSSDSSDEGEQGEDGDDQSQAAGPDENGEKGDQDNEGMTVDMGGLHTSSSEGFDKRHGDECKAKGPNLDLTPDFDEGVAEALADHVAKANSNKSYVPFTRDFDTIVPVELNAGVSSKSLEDSTRRIAGVMQKDIQRLIAARSQSFRQAGQRKGKLHSSSLHRLIAGDSRVFSQKHQAINKNTAITLLIDCSGSMHGRSAAVAMEAAFAFAETLSRINVDFEVLGFTTRYTTDKEASEINETMKKFGGDFTRITPILMPLFKSFEEGFSTVQKGRMAAAWSDFRNVNCHTNIDGDSLRMAAQRLATRNSERKVMFVFSDGQPAGCYDDDDSALYEDLKNAIKETESAGIETIGFGIMTDGPQYFYPKYAIINELSDLPNAVMKELRKILLN